MFNKQVYKDRRAELRNRIKTGLIVFLGNDYASINYPANAYRFRQDSNFSYYFGLNLPNLVGIIDLEGGKDYIYGDDVSMDDIIWMGPQESLSSQAERAGVQSTRPFRDAQKEITAAIKSGRKVRFLAPYRGDQKLLLSEWLGVMPRHLDNYVSRELTHAVIAQRSVKEPIELEELDRIQEVGYQMHVTAMRMAQPGQSEQVIAGIIDGIAMSYAHQPSFSTILSMNGQTLHNEKHDGILEAGRLMLVDCGAEAKSYYASDNTRTTPVGGKFSQKQLAIYETVLKALEKGVERSKPGVRYLDVHLEACRVITEGLQAVGIMQGDIDESVASGAHALFFPHGLGHMIGLDCHDMEGLGEDLVGYDRDVERVDQFGTASLRCGKRLQEGFVVSVEPGIYFIPELIDKWKRENINSRFINHTELEKYRDFGGIRLEDCIAITKDGCRLIGKKRIPITPQEVSEEVQKGL